MKVFITFSIIFLFTLPSLASSLISEFKEIRKNDMESSKVFETNNYYFSQISYNWKKKSNRKKLSRKGILESINQFKTYIFKSNKILNEENLNIWGKSLFVQSQIKFKNSRKIEERRFKDRYLVVFAFPKEGLVINNKNINVNQLIKFNTLNHFNMTNDERTLFLKKLNFNDIILLWNIDKLDNKYNLTNFLTNVDPIKYQKKILEILKNEEVNLNLLNKAPGFTYIIDKYLQNNKFDNKMQKLSILSSKCVTDSDFKNSLVKYKFENLEFKSNNGSRIIKALNKCSGYLRFDYKFKGLINTKLLEIEKQFNAGKNLDSLITKIENALIQSPLKFKLWSYYSACLRAKKMFNEALITSRVEISVALKLNDKKKYIDALKSYSKAKIRLLKNPSKSQKLFLETII
jgi:hypothetical protein